MTGTVQLDQLGLCPTQSRTGRAYLAYPNWRRARWIIPAESALRRAGLQLYTPQRLRGRVLKGAMAMGRLWGERVWLDPDTLGALGTALGGCVGEPAVSLAFYLGTPGAYRKITIQVTTAAGRVLGYAKISDQPLAQAALEAEWRTLRQLSAWKNLRGRVPEVVYWGDWRAHKVLLTTAGPPHPGPPRLGCLHFEFLRDLQAAFSEERSFDVSSMFMSLMHATRRWGLRYPDPWPERLTRAMRCLEERLGSVRLPLCMAHRDFTPWNTRVGPRGLFVFDWEAAADGLTPLYDAFHFEAIQAALGAPSRPGSESLTELLAVLWPAGARHFPWLYFAYLVDMSLYYGEARRCAPDAGDERVLRWLGKQIDTRLEGSYGAS